MGKQRRRIAPTIQYRIFASKIRQYHVETWHICNIGTLVRPNRFCPKICHVGGRMISVMLLSDRLRRSLDFDSLRGAPPLRTQEFGAIRKIRTGCDAVRLRRGGYQPPGCFPVRKTTSAQSADNGIIEHLQMKFGGIMLKRGTLRHVVPHDSHRESPGG